jgi:hypothetical protein
MLSKRLHDRLKEEKDLENAFGSLGLSSDGGPENAPADEQESINRDLEDAFGSLGLGA